MVQEIKNIVWKIFKNIDSKLKFPNLKPGEIGIQLGVDMSSPLTSDLFSMYSKVKPSGKILGIDPDIRNITIAEHICNEQKLNIDLIHKAIFSEKGEVEIAFGEKASWNQLTNIPIDSTVSFNGSKEKVAMDTLDNIVNDEKIDIDSIGHINITINGSEYYALLGMTNILEKANNIALTIVAGRYDESGDINGVPDHEMIINLLNKHGFNYEFKRIHQLIWWGFFTKLLLNRKWVYGKENYGIIMAYKGNKKNKCYQSYS